MLTLTTWTSRSTSPTMTTTTPTAITTSLMTILNYNNDYIKKVLRPPPALRYQRNSRNITKTTKTTPATSTTTPIKTSNRGQAGRLVECDAPQRWHTDECGLVITSSGRNTVSVSRPGYTNLQVKCKEWGSLLLRVALASLICTGRKWNIHKDPYRQLH